MSLVLDLNLKPAGHSKLPAPALKVCTGCQAVKPLEDYRAQRTGRLGRMSQCKACKGAYDKALNATPGRKAANHAREQTAEFKARRQAYDRDRNRTTDRRSWLYNKDRRRRALSKGVEAERFSDADLFAHWDDVGYYACYWCDAPFTEADPLHRDHVTPLTKGGAHALSNLVPAHQSCNTSKGARDPLIFAKGLHPWL